MAYVEVLNMKHDYAPQFKNTTTNWWVLPIIVTASVLWLMLFLAMGELSDYCIGRVCV